MRGLVANLPSPYPLAEHLPAVYQDEDAFTVRLTAAMDEVLAPIVATLDSLPAYFNPRFTPDDFLGWLASWVAFDLDETWDAPRRREAVSRAVDLLRRRGTAMGLAEEIRLVTGAEVEIIESGGAAWSMDPMSPMVGEPEPMLLVRVTAADPSSIDEAQLERLVATAKPAHVPHKIDLVGPSGRSPKG